METLQNIDVQDLVLRLVLTALALAAIWMLRRAVTRLLMPLLRRLVGRSRLDVDDVLVDAIRLPVRLLIIALGIYVAALILSPDGLSAFIENLVRSLVIAALFVVLYKAVGLVTRSSPIVADLTGLRIDAQLLPFVRTALQVVLVAIAVVIVLQEWDYDVGGLIAGLGLGGLAFALAAEDTVANLFGFTTIVGDRPLAVGEFIVTPDVEGIVEHVGFRSTRIRTLDRAIVTIPNSKLASSVVTNWSRLKDRRLNMTLGLAYDTTSDQMRTLLERLKALLRSREHVIEDTITVLFTGFGDSALEVLVRCYIALPDWTAFMEEQQAILLTIMDTMKELGLSFAPSGQAVQIEVVPQRVSSDIRQIAEGSS